MTRHPQTGYFYRHHHALGDEVQAALVELRAAHARADTRGMVLAGYSQGSIMGALHAHTVPAQISRLLLVEGGFDEWDVGTAKRYRAAGGKRVALVCGITHCAQRAKHARAALSRAGVPVQFAHAPQGGHTYTGSVGKRALALLPWLVADDKRWDTWRNHL
jgi:predicted esterase